MNIEYDICLAHIASGLALFLTVNWLGAHSSPYGYKQLSIFYSEDSAPLFNLTFRISAPLVFLILLSAGLYLVALDRYVDQIYWVIIYYVTFRVLFNLATGRGRLVNWVREAFIAACLIFAAKVLYHRMITTRAFLFPNFANIANDMWIGILVFLYAVGNQVRTSSAGSIRRRENYLRANYERFHRQYDSIISAAAGRNPHISALTYAVLIFENFNRPRIVRAIERLILPVSGPRTIGVMQYRSTTNISDEESVRLGAKKIADDWAMGIRKDMPKFIADNTHEKDLGRRRRYAKYQVFRQVIAKYNGGSAYASEIESLYAEILSRYHPSVKRTLANYWIDS